MDYVNRLGCNRKEKHSTLETVLSVVLFNLAWVGIVAWSYFTL